MNHNEPEKKWRIPLRDRLQLAHGARTLPHAVGLRDCDFFTAVSMLTGEEEKYSKVRESYLLGYGSTDEERMDVYDLVTQAAQFDDELQENFLYWTLVEPFAAIKKAEETSKKYH